MTKTTIIAALTLVVLASEVSAQSRDASTTDSSGTTTSAQSRSIYDASGKLIGSVTTDSRGTVTFYDPSEQVSSREVPFRRADLPDGMICGFAGPCWNPSEKFGGHP